MTVVMQKMSKTFEFTFVISGVDPHAENFEDAFFEAGCDDATLMLYKGSVIATFAREHETYSDAVVSAYANLRVAGAEIERFDPDFLVTKSDIAERSGLTRQAITHYANGERGEGFPPPSFRIMTSSPLWDWVDVSDWLYKNEHVARDVFLDAMISRGVNMFIEKHAPLTATENVIHEKIEREAVLVA